jgi:hypothetical protein
MYKGKDKQLKNRYFMPHLALMDLLACFVGCFMFLYTDFNQFIFTSDVGCRLLKFTAWSTNAVSVLMLVVISVDRYLKICRPTQQQMTLFWKRISLLIITIVSVVSCLPYLHFSGVHIGRVNTTEFPYASDLPIYLQNKSLGFHRCAIQNYNNIHVLLKIFYHFQILLHFGIIITLIFLYVPMGILIYKKYRQYRNVRSMASRTGVSTENGTNTNVTTADSNLRVPQQKAWNNAKNRFTIMFLLVVIVYVVTKLPMMIFLYAYMESKRFRQYIISESDFEIYNLLLLLPRLQLINNIANPFLYGYFDLAFRREVKAILYITFYMKPKQLCCSRNV